jgi:hypothetical protein
VWCRLELARSLCSVCDSLSNRVTSQQKRETCCAIQVIPACLIQVVFTCLLIVMTIGYTALASKQFHLCLRHI